MACFFFQAEDGIRDSSVTGVQTCALPIYPRDIPGFVKELRKHKFTIFTGVNTLFNALMNHSDFTKIDFSGLKVALGGGMRSEERRVGKECRSRWSPYH